MIDMNKKLIAFSCSLLFTLNLAAQVVWVAEKPQRTTSISHWYIGLRGGIPLGISTFSSFGADKTRAGISGGVYGGYRFHPAVSIEASTVWGKADMNADKACLPYWLGTDGHRYLAPVAGMEGWNYSDIYSQIAMQQYGIHLNINVLGFFTTTRSSRWSINLSPALYGVGTKATIKTFVGNSTALQGDQQWHLGMGGDLMAKYAITKNLTAGIYTGITYLTGAKMDGMPPYAHNDNKIWESGIRIGWCFSKRGKKTTDVTPAVTPMPSVQNEMSEPVVKEDPTTVVVQTPKEDTAQPQTSQKDKAETVIDASTAEKSSITFPTLYFAFNSVAISADQTGKLEQILATLRKHPTLQVTITGWCDSRGTVEVNNRISQLRAEVIRSYLTRAGIAPHRIKAVGMGTDTEQPEANKSRRAETTDKK